MQATTPAASAPSAAAPGVTAAATEPAVAETAVAETVAPAMTGVATAPPAARTQTTVQVPDRPAASAPSNAGTAASAVLALLLVVGLILLLAWLAKRMPGLTGTTHPGLRVLGSVALGPRDRVVLVEVGQTQLLVGVGAGGPRTLHTLDTPLAAPAPATPSPFAQVLAQHFRKRA
ncbi:flagellar biosynthetic protein FliO [Aerolutibacter ruishenii]|uniref:Flagellar protein n=1 Tax=Aerolutibacter ruishenii TaxID=686800 RepID=A0A562LK70_9GAMM|nr:flagellar biosynthetic protein FliO [Lysobacter ruishenii]TWI08018.1 flagellar protein FliO/FliZ [Lysobacter ruishenii]